eukprot:TRINITY_DN3092_c0_g1_i5.p1 TRINITY_DN3092_c0_g1~~TRINITY_DN3092_c0_g1_i5.p1  ORF type:complete len:187 (-),score=44.82 TRINITY_DN3092_c0_g1_i5:1771-2331(-)
MIGSVLHHRKLQVTMAPADFEPPRSEPEIVTSDGTPNNFQDVFEEMVEKVGLSDGWNSLFLPFEKTSIIAIQKQLQEQYDEITNDVVTIQNSIKAGLTLLQEQFDTNTADVVTRTQGVVKELEEKYDEKTSEIVTLTQGVVKDFSQAVSIAVDKFTEDVSVLQEMVKDNAGWEQLLTTSKSNEVEQ